MVKFIMMVGVPGSGKTYHAKQYREEHPDFVYLSSDEYRERLLGDVNDQTKNSFIFEKLYADTVSALNSGKSVIYDATNISLKNRLNTLRQISNTTISFKEIEKIAWVIAPTIESVLVQNSKRDRVVNENVIYKQLSSFQFPQKFEGFDYIWLNDFKETELPEYDSAESDMLIVEMSEFEQHNPHHIYTVGDHCNEVACLAYQHYHKWTPMVCAGSFHDVGKMFTQHFDDDGVAHYYNHDSIGTYYLASHINVLVATCWDDIFEELFYVNYHMRAHRDFKTPKAERKYRGIFGDERYERLMLFGEFDRIASGTYKKNETS